MITSFAIANAQSSENSVAAQPKVIEAMAPEYPKDALLLRAEQSVSVKVMINKKGIVSSAKLIKGHKLFAKSSLDAAKQWKFNEAKTQSKRTDTIEFIYRIANKNENLGVTFFPPNQIEIVDLGSDRIYGTPDAYQSSSDLLEVTKSVLPSYPVIALTANVSGMVEVEIKIDKDGKVVSAKANNGHILLKAAAVSVAYN